MPAERAQYQVSGSFLVEYYQDWSDYPGWEPYEDDDGHEIRFSTVGEARAWIEQKREADNAESVAAWERDQEKVREAQELRQRRERILADAGLGKQDGEYSVLSPTRTGYSRPKPTPADKFRVVLDAERCPTCGVRSGGGNLARENESRG